MKFIYVDETGSKSEGDVFVMTGLLVERFFVQLGSRRILCWIKIAYILCAKYFTTST